MLNLLGDMIFTFVITSYIISLNAEDCGPIGYDAKELLSPSYWYFDLPHNQCPPIPQNDMQFLNPVIANTTMCRIYFNLCQAMTFQCTGSVCVNYLDTEDYIINLGTQESHPFTEAHNANGFQAHYTGETLDYNEGRKKVKTIFSFTCDKNKTWNINVGKQHGGSLSPNPDSVSFNVETCEYTVSFNYSGACLKLPENDSRAKNISTGSLILILFFPAVALYFLLGVLINRMRGHTGKDMIPHRHFWTDLPELIMDGFAFTMAIVTCRKEDRYIKEYESIE